MATCICSRDLCQAGMSSHCFQLCLICVISLFILNIPVSSNEDLMPQTLKLVAGNTMYLSWQAEEGPLTSCFVVTPQEGKVLLDPAFGDGQVVYSGIGLSGGVCGLRADNVSSKDAGVWLFTATGQTVSHRSTTVSVSEAVVEGVTRNITVNIQETIHLQCGPEENVLYCELVSPTGELTAFRLKKCDINIYPIKYSHAGIWKCQFLLQYQSFEGHASTIVNINTDNRNFVIGQNETEMELNIFCSHPAKPIQNTAYCSIVPPNDSKRIMLAPGRGLSRYKFFGAAPYHCGVSIRKPVRESEYGSWLCELAYTSSGHQGGYIHVLKNKETSKAIEPLQKSSSLKVVLSLRDIFAFKCSVLHSLTYCSVQHPNGTVYSPNPAQSNIGFKYFGEGYDFGQCGIQLDNPNLNDSGRWFCIMGLLTETTIGTQEVTTVVDVQISELPLAANEQHIVAKKGATVNVGCGMVHSQAVTYCRFWKPDRTGLAIDRSTNTSIRAKYQYIGRGLHVGDCTLRVSGLESGDFGSWICATTPIFVIRGGEITTTFEIIQDNEGISLAAGFGILIGVAVAAGLVTVLFIYKNRTKLKQNNSNDALIPSAHLEEVGSEPGPSYNSSLADNPYAGVKFVAKKRIVIKKRNQVNKDNSVGDN